MTRYTTHSVHLTTRPNNSRRSSFWPAVRTLLFAHASEHDARIPYRPLLARAAELIQDGDRAAGRPPRKETAAKKAAERVLADLGDEHRDALVLERSDGRQRQQITQVVLDRRLWQGYHQAQWLGWLFDVVQVSTGEPLTRGWLAKRMAVDPAMLTRWCAGTAVMTEERVDDMAREIAQLKSRKRTTGTGRRTRRGEAVLRQLDSAWLAVMGRDAGALGRGQQADIFVHSLQTLGFCHFMLAAMEDGLTANETARATVFAFGSLLPAPAISGLPDDARDVRDLAESATWLYATADRNRLSTTGLVHSLNQRGVPHVVDLENTVSVGPAPPLLERLAKRVEENRDRVRRGSKPRLERYLKL